VLERFFERGREPIPTQLCKPALQRKSIGLGPCDLNIQDLAPNDVVLNARLGLLLEVC